VTRLRPKLSVVRYPSRLCLSSWSVGGLRGSVGRPGRITVETTHGCLLSLGCHCLVEVHANTRKRVWESWASLLSLPRPCDILLRFVCFRWPISLSERCFPFFRYRTNRAVRQLLEAGVICGNTSEGLNCNKRRSYHPRSLC